MINRKKLFQRLFPFLSSAFQSGFMKSFTTRIDFSEPFFARGMRILMKKPLYNSFFGIYRVEVWVDDWTVMFVADHKAKSGLFYSLSALSGEIRNNVKLVSSELTKNIAKMDRREVFVYSYE